MSKHNDYIFVMTPRSVWNGGVKFVCLLTQCAVKRAAFHEFVVRETLSLRFGLPCVTTARTYGNRLVPRLVDSIISSTCGIKLIDFYMF